MDRTGAVKGGPFQIFVTSILLQNIKVRGPFGDIEKFSRKRRKSVTMLKKLKGPRSALYVTLKKRNNLYNSVPWAKWSNLTP